MTIESVVCIRSRLGGSPVNVKVYNPAVNSWATLGTMPSFQGEFALAVD